VDFAIAHVFFHRDAINSKFTLLPSNRVTDHNMSSTEPAPAAPVEKLPVTILSGFLGGMSRRLAAGIVSHKHRLMQQSLHGHQQFHSPQPARRRC